MDIQTPLEADAQFAEASKPGMGSLDHPSVASKSLLTFHAAPGDACRDPSLFQVLPAAGEVVALVRMQFIRAFAGPATQARHCRDCVNRALERDRVMPVGSGDRDRQGDAASVYDEVSFRPEFAAVRWVGAGFRAPRGLGALAASTLARPQSIWSCSRNRRSIARCSLSHMPAACQSRKRRQHVMPLPKPSSWGRSSQGIPVCRTNRMPLNAARSSIARRRPPLGDAVKTGINGSSAAHNSLLIFRLVIPPGYGLHGVMSRLR